MLGTTLRGCVLLAAGSSLAGCTAVRWRDADGVEHHFGLLAYRVREYPHGQELRVVTAGIGLRLSGPDCGIDAGINVTDELRPENVRTSDGRSLGPQVVAFLREAPRSKDAVKSHWGFFYLEDPDGDRNARVFARTYGAGIFDGDARRGLGVGYADVDAYVGAVLEDDIAYVRRPDGATVLWKLGRSTNASGPGKVIAEVNP